MRFGIATGMKLQLCLCEIMMEDIIGSHVIVRMTFGEEIQVLVMCSLAEFLVEIFAESGFFMVKI